MLVRVDDFPYSGPKSNQVWNYHDDYKEKALLWIKPFEENKINYILGVSPLLLNEGDVEFLNTNIKHGNVVMHGFDHGFSIWEKVGDIVTTWKGGGEFSNLTHQEISYRYNKCNEILSQIDSYDESHFVPPFNAITQPLLDVLSTANVKYIHGESDFWQEYISDMNFNFHHLQYIVSKTGTEYASIDTVINNIDVVENPTLHWLFDLHEGLIHHYGEFAKMVSEKEFWNVNVDRQYMKNILYPEIGLHFKDKESKKVLDIGVQDYNKDNKKLFINNDIEYWQIDDFSDGHSLNYSKNTIELSCDKFINTSMIDLLKKCPETKNYFDCIISIGVLGFYRFEPEIVNSYIDSVHSCLKEGGLFYLQYARDLKEFYIDEDKISQLFSVERKDKAGCFYFLKMKKKE